eukprot:279882_1
MDTHSTKVSNDVEKMDEPLLFNKLIDEFIERGFQVDKTKVLISHLLLNEYDTDAVEYDVFTLRTQYEHESLLYVEINNNKQFAHLQDIVDDHINEYDKAENQRNQNKNKKCESLFDMDDALSYFVSMRGKKQLKDYYDKNGCGIFNQLCGDYKRHMWTNEAIETDLLKEKSDHRDCSLLQMIKKERVVVIHSSYHKERNVLGAFDLTSDASRDTSVLTNSTLRLCWFNKYSFAQDQFEYEPNCLNIKYCSSIQNICRALRFYHESKDDESVYDYLENDYMHLETDFHHILVEHLSEKNPQQNNRNLQKINYMIACNVVCSLDQCIQFARNNRNKDKEPHTIDIHHQYCIDLLDNIHVYFLHSYAMGFRVNDSLLQNDMLDDAAKIDDEKTNDENYASTDIKTLYIDNAFNKLKTFISSKRRNVKIDRLSDKQKKYVTKIDIQQPVISVDMQEAKQSPDASSVAQYSFGRRYWYWEWYKCNNDADKYNPGY